MSALDKLDASLLVLVQTVATRLNGPALDAVMPALKTVSSDFDALRAELSVASSPLESVDPSHPHTPAPP